jgi:hypothetical protein
MRDRPTRTGSGVAAKPRQRIAASLAHAAGRHPYYRPTEPSERLVLALLARMSEETRLSFTAAQVEALRAAAHDCRWGRHPLDLTLSLPGPGGRLYLRLIAGRERRRA